MESTDAPCSDASACEMGEHRIKADSDDDAYDYDGLEDLLLRSYHYTLRAQASNPAAHGISIEVIVKLCVQKKVLAQSQRIKVLFGPWPVTFHDAQPVPATSVPKPRRLPCTTGSATAGLP